MVYIMLVVKNFIQIEIAKLICKHLKKDPKKFISYVKIDLIMIKDILYQQTKLDI